MAETRFINEDEHDLEVIKEYEQAKADGEVVTYNHEEAWTDIE